MTKTKLSLHHTVTKIKNKQNIINNRQLLNKKDGLRFYIHHVQFRILYGSIEISIEISNFICNKCEITYPKLRQYTQPA